MNRFIDQVYFNMVKIPAGKVELRDDRIKKEWQVQIKPFLLAKYVLTVELFYSITNRALNGNENSNKPVVNISWNDAIMFL